MTGTTYLGGHIKEINSSRREFVARLINESSLHSRGIFEVVTPSRSSDTPSSQHYRIRHLIEGYDVGEIDETGIPVLWYDSNVKSAIDLNSLVNLFARASIVEYVEIGSSDLTKTRLEETGKELLKIAARIKTRR